MYLVETNHKELPDAPAGALQYSDLDVVVSDKEQEVLDRGQLGMQPVGVHAGSVPGSA